MDRIGDKKMKYEEELSTKNNTYYDGMEFDFDAIKTPLDIVSINDIKDIIADGIDTYEDVVEEDELYLAYDGYTGEYNVISDGDLYDPYSDGDLEPDYFLLVRFDDVRTNGKFDDGKIKTLMQYGDELFDLLHNKAFSLYELTTKTLKENFKTYDDYNDKAKEYGILIYDPVKDKILFGDPTAKDFEDVYQTFDRIHGEDRIRDEFIKRNAKYVVTKENKRDGTISFELSGELKKDDNTYTILYNTETNAILDRLEDICTYGMDMEHRISTLGTREQIQEKLDAKLNELKNVRDYDQDFER